MADKARDIPLAELTLRKYEKPYALEERELVRKVCLSVGLLQYGDSRDIIVDIFLVLLKYGPIEITDLETKVKELRAKYNLPQYGIASSNIRRQLRRLKEAHMAEKFDGVYRIIENSHLSEMFEEKIQNYLLPSIVGRVKEYLVEVEKLRPKQPEPLPDTPVDTTNGVKHIVLK
jgi:DNA-binding transcriptional ArsR family regulator